eukprot:CAMPEP_0119298040 /NCGR_PEP_ID=MMETSP1333-20130426/253_1 /TAXON_ID=418940 /ORGANISM="Scyphosphaera apsteinii, Strain RCC1455" /LENGTH=147 /DNA_ID=CAMNT_0007299031 /DNA_START=26 /DNA_END=469 /DNA_ORIENTATION=+
MVPAKRSSLSENGKSNGLQTTKLKRQKSFFNDAILEPELVEPIPFSRTGLSGNLSDLSLTLGKEEPKGLNIGYQSLTGSLKPLPKSEHFSTEQIMHAVSIQRITRGYQARAVYQREVWIAYYLSQDMYDEARELGWEAKDGETCSIM